MSDDMSEDRREYLRMIQAVITRMNTNSFQIKTWQTGLVTSIVLLAAATQMLEMTYYAIIPTVILWMLDAYYLLYERKYRGLFNDAALLTKKPLITRLYDMNVSVYNTQVNRKYNYISVLISKTIWPVYIGMIVILLVIA